MNKLSVDRGSLCINIIVVKQGSFTKNITNAVITTAVVNLIAF